MTRMRRGRLLQVAMLSACAGTCVAWPVQPEAVPASGGAGVQPAPGEPFEFSAVPFAQGVIKGDFSLTGLRVNVWDQGDTRRMFASGQVVATVGEYTFRADRAVVWLARVHRASGDVQQVFMYLDGVRGGAQSAGGSAFIADSMPVRAVLTADSPVLVTGALVLTTQPAETTDAENATLAAGRSALLKSQQRELNAGKPVTPPPVPVFAPDADLVGAAFSQWAARGITPPMRPGGIVAAPERLATGPLPGMRPVEPKPGPGEVTPGGQAGPGAPAEPGPAKVAGAGSGGGAAGGTPPAGQAGGARTPGEPIFAKDGIIVIAPGDVTLVRGDDDNSIIASGGVTLQYSDPATGKLLQLSAERAVVFTKPGPISDMLRLGVEQVRGIYIEGDAMATDGQYTLRGAQVYYDVQANKAVVLDAVFWTYDQLQKLTVYVRAKTLRQTAASTFTGEDAEITNTSFVDGELSLGVSKLTITKKQAPDQRTSVLNPAGPPQTTTWVEAQGITPEFEGTPFFWFPEFAGDPKDKTLKNFILRNRSGSGLELAWVWNAYALLGLEEPGNASVELLTDLYIERGPAIGVKADWKEDAQKGELFAYTLPIDRGWDTTQSGAQINHDEDFRGIIYGEERWRVDDTWTIFGEISYQSDPTFVPAFFAELGRTSREFTNAIDARRLEDNSYLSLEVRGNLNNFLTNEYLEESQGYSVTKTPQFTYARLADDVLGGLAPGFLTYTSEYSATRMQLNFDTATAAEHGLISDRVAQAAFGINANQNFADVLTDRGLSESGVIRLDTRQELSLQADVGPIKINPFVVGRVTWYDNDFAAYSPDENDNTRLWGAAGVRFSTTIQRVYDEADSELLDIHRLRHIIEPNAAIWYSGTNVKSQDLPIYDQPVEQLVNGGMYKVGINQTFQTQRGGPGQWHNVDLLTLNTNYIYSTGDTEQTSPYGRFFDYRPEYSNAGQWGTIDAALRLTDATSVTAGEIFNFDKNEVAMTSVGLLIREAPKFSAAVDLRFLNPEDSTFLNIVLSYELTSKYSLTLGAEFDATTGDFQTAIVEIHRKFRSLELAVAVATDQITGETGVSVNITPYGSSGGVGVVGLGGKSLGSRIGGQ